MTTSLMNIEYQESELASVAERLLKEFGSYKVWAFDAPMGAGKTTLIKELCHLLGVEETTSSPTFAIINEYQSAVGSVYHFDCYRFETLADAYSIGSEEYIESGDYCFIEWPEVMEAILPLDTLWVRIEIVSNDTRRLIVEQRG